MARPSSIDVPVATLPSRGSDRRRWSQAGEALRRWVHPLIGEHPPAALDSDFAALMGELAEEMRVGHPVGLALMIGSAREAWDREVAALPDYVARRVRCTLFGPLMLISFPQLLFEPLEAALHRLTRDNADVACGIAFSGHLDNHEDLLLASRMALHQAIARRLGVRVLDSAETRQTLADHQAASLMKKHLADGGRHFEAHFQPQVDLRSTRPTGAEALARWRPAAEDVPPGQFIPLAEEAGLIGAIGELMIVRSARALKFVRRGGADIEHISVNVSPHQRREGDLLRLMLDVLRDERLSPADLEIELTESLVGGGQADLLKWLGELAEAGFSIAIDDFGTGTSTLARIIDLPASRIKLDRSFVTALPDNFRAREVCQATLNLIHVLGKESIAEGVENSGQASYLEAHRCGLGQGYLWARPMPERDLLAWWGQRSNGVSPGSLVS